MPGKAKDINKTSLIAVVDDDEDVRLALDGLLGSLGYDAELFDNADSLLACPRIGNFDCIISDVQMPGTNGLQLARTIQPSHTPIILITAFPNPEVERQASAAGVCRLLSKPFESDDLVDKLAELLD